MPGALLPLKTRIFFYIFLLSPFKKALEFETNPILFFIVVKYTHEICHFKVYSSGGWLPSGCSADITTIPLNFLFFPNETMSASSTASPSGFPQSRQTPRTSCLHDVTPLGTSYKDSHRSCPSVVYFSEHNVFKVHPCCALYRISFLCEAECVYRLLCVHHSLMDAWGASPFGYCE